MYFKIQEKLEEDIFGGQISKNYYGIKYLTNFEILIDISEFQEKLSF